MPLTRRSWLQVVGVSWLSACSPAGPHASFRRGGTAALDWALAETLIALGQPPSGVVAAADWAHFVVEPALPPKVADLGLQQELNFELLALLRPEIILISPFLAHLEPRLKRIAPTWNLSVYEAASSPLSNRLRVTRTLAERLGVSDSAERIIAELEARRLEAQRGLEGRGRKPLLFLSFVDNRHARVYGSNSLYGDVLAWLGLENAWRRPVGYFGFSTVGIEELATLGEVELVAIAPVPPDIARALSISPLWTELPLVRAGTHGVLPPVFMFGALPSADRLMRLLVPYLQRRWA